MTPAIFYKDVRIGLKNLLIAPAVVATWPFLKVVAEGYYGQVLGEREFALFSIATFVGLNCLIAMAVGAQVSAEERNAGTDLLLARLPISRWHLYTEKVVAGLTCVGLLYIATLVYLFFINADAVWDSESALGTLPRYFFISMFSSYFFAIACSRFTQQSIAIMFISFGAVCLLWLGIAVAHSVEEVDWHALRMTIAFMLLFFAVPAILVWRQWQLPLSPDLWRSPHQWIRITGLIWKSFAENGFLHAMCFLLLLATAVLPLVAGESMRFGENGSLAETFIPTLGVLLLAALGTNSYATSERKGLHCITYYHPIPRGLLLVTKQVAAIPAIAMVSLALVITLEGTAPAVSIVVLSTFLYLHAVQLCLTFPTGTVLVILAAFFGVWLAIAPIVAWMIPTEIYIVFEGFTPVHDPLLVGLVPLGFVTLGTALITWRLATNRRFLASSDRYRQRYSLACSLIVGAVTCVFVSVIQAVVVL